MKRILPPYALGPGPRDGCWWDETIPAPDWPVHGGGGTYDVAIVGGGFTGISAAYHLARSGASVAVLEEQTPGWGASGRNGGFCCLGGSKLSETRMAKLFGQRQADLYNQAECAAVDLVADLLSSLGIEADTHSKGETQLAHSHRAMDRLRRDADALFQAGVEPDLIEQPDLERQGLGGAFFGALTHPKGFALNPRKYLFGLAEAARSAGAVLYQKSGAQRIERRDGGFDIETPHGYMRAETVVIATNGYSSEDLPDWLAGRYLPAQSTVLVTRPLTDADLARQGWSSDQMAFDTRHLLHYFRLMPDQRFLFGMRGGIASSPNWEQVARQRTRAAFEAMFPAWRHVAATHSWSGMVCLSRRLVPFVGPVPNTPGMFAGLAFHGNGVAMGTYAGRLLSDLVAGKPPNLPYPAPMQHPMTRFPLGSSRRLLLAPVYATLHMLDL